MKYVKSLKEPVKRRFAVDYLDWLRNGKKGDQPARGALASGIASAVCLNIDALN
ncbi:MAG: hypothetical protein ABL949_12945 [Fimbriimonadaceae bacterium]